MLHFKINRKGETLIINLDKDNIKQYQRIRKIRALRSFLNSKGMQVLDRIKKILILNLINK